MLVDESIALLSRRADSIFADIRDGDYAFPTGMDWNRGDAEAVAVVLKEIAALRFVDAQRRSSVEAAGTPTIYAIMDELVMDVNAHFKRCGEYGADTSDDHHDIIDTINRLRRASPSGSPTAGGEEPAHKTVSEGFKDALRHIRDGMLDEGTTLSADQCHEVDHAFSLLAARINPPSSSGSPASPLSEEEQGEDRRILEHAERRCRMGEGYITRDRGALGSALRHVLDENDRLRFEIDRLSSGTPREAGSAPEKPRLPRISPENNWREVWHTDCPKWGAGAYPQRDPTSAIMQRVAGTLTIEDGSELRRYRCLSCNVECFAGLDAKRLVTARSTEGLDP